MKNPHGAHVFFLGGIHEINYFGSHGGQPGKGGMAGLEPWEGGVAGNKQWEKEIVDKSWKKILKKTQKQSGISERSEEMPDFF